MILNLFVLFVFLLLGKPKDPSERFDRQSWKSMQLTMNDSSKFVDMLHNVPWEDGLPKEVLSGRCYTL